MDCFRFSFCELFDAGNFILGCIVKPPPPPAVFEYFNEFDDLLLDIDDVATVALLLQPLLAIVADKSLFRPSNFEVESDEEDVDDVEYVSLSFVLLCTRELLLDLVPFDDVL